MSDLTTHLLLPWMAAVHAQKHVTFNEAIRLLDGLVQLAALDAHCAAPPAAPFDGGRHIVAASATGTWSGWGRSTPSTRSGSVPVDRCAIWCKPIRMRDASVNFSQY